MEWISVKDRLPEVEIPVLVVGKPYSNWKAAVAFAVLTPESEWRLADCSFSWLELEMENNGDDFDDDPIKPTHWMPLPAAPK